MAVQWYEIFADALEDEPVVAVADVVRRYIRREPTRAELHAARRAANRYAELGHAVASHAPTGNRRLLLLARLDVDVTADVERLHDAALGRRPPPTRRGAPRSERQVVNTLTRHVCSAGNAARRVDVDKLAGRDAAAFALDLAAALRDLERLRNRLTRRGSSVHE